MKTKIFFFFAIFIAIIFSSCSKNNYSFLSKQIVKEKKIRPENLKKIQFYLGPQDQDIVLEKVVVKDTFEICEGKLTLTNKEDLDRLTIKYLTKGELISSDSLMTRLVLSFSENRNDTLIFKIDREGTYSLSMGKGIFNYHGKTYKIVIQGTEMPKLLIDMGNSQSRSEKVEVAKGRKIK